MSSLRDTAIFGQILEKALCCPWKLQKAGDSEKYLLGQQATTPTPGCPSPSLNKRKVLAEG